MTTGATSTGPRRSRAPEWDALFIGWALGLRAGRPAFEVVSPHDAGPVGRAPMATADDVDLAVAAARQAFDAGPWPRLEPGQRVEALRRFADIYEARLEEMALLITAESGSPITFSRLAQAWAPWSLLDTTLGLASVIEWEEERAGAYGTTLVRREPVGVVAAIAPWNVPQMTIISKLAPALVAGCTIVVKPSPETPLDGLLMAEWIDEAGLPEGVVSVLPADREVGEHLVSRPGVDRVAFTGSTAAGRRIGAICGQQIKRVGLELGGKSAAIVLEDADLDETVGGLRFASFMNSGQACAAQTRVLVPRHRHQEIADAMGEMAGSLVVGDPLDDATEIGPMVSPRHQQRVAGYIGVGIDEGARVVTGGPGAPDGLSAGCYVRPTIFASVGNDMRVAREEIFGPVVVVIPYDGEDDAIRIANESEYGLAGSVWTGDRSHGLEVARRIRTGTIGVNKYAPDLSSPFGGYKSSGIGREYGREGLEEYFELKSIAP